MHLPDDLRALLEQPSLCFIATTMPDGSPQLTQTWADTDGEHILVNSVQGFQKVRNVERDPRMALVIADAANPSRHCYNVRGRVVDVTTEGGAEHIEKLSQRYLGEPYGWFAGREQVRVVLRVEADRIGTPGPPPPAGEPGRGGQ
jgi:PPOX class probable F420-dependent enzyme